MCKKVNGNRRWIKNPSQTVFGLLKHVFGCSYSSLKSEMKSWDIRSNKFRSIGFRVVLVRSIKYRNKV